MTMRTCGRVVPFGVAESEWLTIMFMTAPRVSEIAGDTKPLEGVLGLVVKRAAGALRHLGLFELDEDFLDIRRGRLHRESDVGIAQRAITLAVLGEIKRNNRDVLTLGVGPDVGLGPMQDRVNAQMGARRRRGVELVPELRRLVAHVPAAFGAAGREHTL